MVLQQYIEGIEAKQIAIQKFKHDYQNILLSINGFILTEDWEGLKQYMLTVNTASNFLTEDTPALENLCKIRPTEIKIFLSEKLITAKKTSKHISASFEARGEVSHFPIDSVTLVRMLGIILDNAVEALAELSRGHLAVICHKVEEGVIITIQNNCAKDMPTLNQLKQYGFSTKGKGRGHGLNILADLVNTHPNVTLSTSISEGIFAQMLVLWNTSL